MLLKIVCSHMERSGFFVIKLETNVSSEYKLTRAMLVAKQRVGLPCNISSDKNIR